jgi:protein-disulfide isomerase
MKFLATLLLVSISLLGQVKSAPSGKSAFDKATLENYLRYSELWIPQVTVKIDDPKPSTAINGFSDVWVHLAYNGQTKDELYYVSADGKSIVRGSAFHIEKSPFQSSVDLLKEDQDPSFGAGANALVNLVLFGDFQCPVCQKENTELRKNLPAAFGDKVRVYFNDFPLTSIHPWAMKASIYGRCAYRQSQDTFWAYHDWIYENQQSVTLENLDAKVQEFAKAKNVDGAKLTACSTDSTAVAEVNRNIEMGHALSVSATPTLFINGRKIEGAMEWAVLTQLLQIEADHAAEAAKSAAATTAAAKSAKADDSCCVVEVPKIGGKK